MAFTGDGVAHTQHPTGADTNAKIEQLKHYTWRVPVYVLLLIALSRPMLTMTYAATAKSITASLMVHPSLTLT